MSTRPVLLVAGACAIACAIPLALPVLGGVSLAVAGATLLKPSFGLIACGVLALFAFCLLWVSRRPKVKVQPSTEGATCRADGACGCRPPPPPSQTSG